jgi:hypothetical protein
MYHSQTQISRLGLDAGPDMTNRKPYRTKAQKALAKKTAYKAEDGTHRSTAPKTYHPDKNKEAQSA